MRYLTATLTALLIFAISGVSFSQTQEKAKKQDSDQFVAVKSQPVLIKKTDPVYPESARKAGIQGKVFVKALIDKDGTVKETEVAKNETGSEDIAKAALDAVKKWTFKPAENDDKKIAIWVMIPVNFKLGDKAKEASKDEVNYAKKKKKPIE